jgi:hypothetical protein
MWIHTVTKTGDEGGADRELFFGLEPLPWTHCVVHFVLFVSGLFPGKDESTRAALLGEVWSLPGLFSLSRRRPAE